jgi:hypothetical protein
VAEKTGEVQIKTQGTVVNRDRLVDQFHDYMRERAVEEGTGAARGEEIEAQQIERILTAESEDDIWDADNAGTIQARDIRDMEVEILDIVPVVSTRQDLENSKGYYVSMNAVCLGAPADILRKTGLIVGDSFVLQTGATRIISKVRAFEAKGWLPMRGVIAGTDTSSGNVVLRFKRLPERTQS